VPVGRELGGTIQYENRYVPVGTNDNPMEIGLAYLRGNGGLSYGAELNVVQDRFSSGQLSDFSAVTAVRWSF
jgi:hypothetical protein